MTRGASLRLSEATEFAKTACASGIAMPHLHALQCWSIDRPEMPVAPIVSVVAQ
jgi:hypothetical protein